MAAADTPSFLQQTIAKIAATQRDIVIRPSRRGVRFDPSLIRVLKPGETLDNLRSVQPTPPTKPSSKCQLAPMYWTR